MKKEKDHRERTLSETQWFWFLAFLGIVTRFPLLKIFSAESTDSILNLVYFSAPYLTTKVFYILPGFPFLLRLGVWAGLDGIFFGRVIAAIAGLLFLIPLWKFSRRWVKTETAAAVCLMGLFSPLLWEMSLKAMTDTLFLAVFWWCLERLSATWLDEEKRAPLWQASLCGAGAALLRPEGFLLLPWILYANERFAASNRWFQRGWTLLCWVYPLFLLYPRMALLGFAYREGMGLTSGDNQVYSPFLNIVRHIYVYITQPVYVFTPILFLLAVLGLYRMAGTQTPTGKIVRILMLPVFFLILVSRLIPTTYQDRHMLPFLPLLLVGAGVELEFFFSDWLKNTTSFRPVLLKNGLLVLCLAYEAVFSSAVIVAKSDSFGDIKRASEFLKTLPVNAVIYSDEIPKSEYWSGRRLLWLDPKVPFKPNPGDYLVLHSFYRPRINFMDENLRARHGAEVLHRDNSMVVPLTTDLIQDPAFQNRPSAVAFRFDPQFFTSVVYQVKR